MNEEIVVAVLALLGTAIGSLAGVMTANRLTNYRLLELEKKVDRHNTVVERIAVAERDIKSAFVQIHDMKELIGG